LSIVSFTPIAVDGQTADAADVNTPLAALYNDHNGNIDNSNIATNAAIAGSKLAADSIDLEAKASVDTGWRHVTDSWTYASATTVTVPTDATTKYSVGDKIKLVQTTTKYFYITAVTATVLTLNGGSDYTVANAAISSIYYSKVTTPLGFPQVFNWTPTFTNVSGGTIGYAKFHMIGKMIFFRMKYTLAGAGISGEVIFSTPVTMSSDYTSETPIAGSAGFVDAGAAAYPARVEANSTTTIMVRPLKSDATYATVSTPASATVPFTFGNTDFFWAAGSCEAA
jgi:hypothetical protein